MAVLSVALLYRIADWEIGRMHLLDTPADDRDDLRQSAVMGMVAARVTSHALATVITRRRLIDSLRTRRGRRYRYPEVLSLEKPPPDPATAERMAAVLSSEEPGYAATEARLDARRQLRPLLAAMGTRERRVLCRWLLRGEGMATIAAREGVSASRISQMCTTALRQARAAHDKGVESCR